MLKEGLFDCGCPVDDRPCRKTHLPSFTRTLPRVTTSYSCGSSRSGYYPDFGTWIRVTLRLWASVSSTIIHSVSCD